MTSRIAWGHKLASTSNWTSQQTVYRTPHDLKFGSKLLHRTSRCRSELSLTASTWKQVEENQGTRSVDACSHMTTRKRSLLNFHTIYLNPTAPASGSSACKFRIVPSSSTTSFSSSRLLSLVCQSLIPNVSNATSADTDAVALPPAIYLGPSLFGYIYDP